MSCTGTTGLTCAGSPPWSAMASRRPARSTSAVWPRMSWQTTRAGNQGKSRSRLPLDQLRQEGVDPRGIGAPHQVLGQHARGVRQARPGPRLQRLHRRAGVEIVEGGARQGLAVGAVHGRRRPDADPARSSGREAPSTLRPDRGEGGA